MFVFIQIAATFKYSGGIFYKSNRTNIVRLKLFKAKDEIQFLNLNHLIRKDFNKKIIINNLLSQPPAVIQAFIYRDLGPK